MGILYVLVIIVTLSTHCSAYVSETDTSIASVILKEGQSAAISCMTKGNGDYFWRKGKKLYNSTLVASFTVGEVSDDSQPYSVTENGTLHIKSVTLKDEGNYFCRLSSTENECYGEVKILVQASLFNFDLAIDSCDRQSSCLLYLDPSQSTSLTCTALNAPPLMTLKWFNGSKEITEGILQNELLSQNGNSREITSTVAAVNGRPASFTCQAVDPKRSNDDVRFAHAQVKMTVPAHETLPSWIIVSVTLAGCFFVFGIFLLIKAMVNRKQRKKYTKLKKEDAELLTDELSKTKEELNKSKQENSELQTKTAKDEVKITYAEESAKTKDQEIANTDQELTDLKKKIANIEATLTATKEIAKIKDQGIANKDQELTDLKGDVRSKAKAIAELEKKIANIEATLTATKESAKNKDHEIANKDKELTDLKGDLESNAKSIADLEDKLKQQEEEIKKERDANTQLQITSVIAEGETTVVEELAERRNKEISELKKKVEKQEKEINNQREKYNDCQTNLHKKEIALQEKSFQISDLKSKLEKKDSELEEISKEQTNLKEDLAKKERAKEQKNSERSSNNLLEGELEGEPMTKELS